MKNDNQGAIWPNKKKQKQTHPDFTGQATINGVEFWVSAWKRDQGPNINNAPSLKFSFKLKEQPQQQVPQQQYAQPQYTQPQQQFNQQPQVNQQPQNPGFPEDEIPF